MTISKETSLINEEMPHEASFKDSTGAGGLLEDSFRTLEPV